MFKLAERPAAQRGIYCGRDGLYLGAALLIETDDNGNYRVRPTAEIEALLAAAYETPPEIRGCLAGLHRVAEHLRSANLPLAMIASVQLGLPEIPEDRIERLARIAALFKDNFSPAQPRDARGRWTSEDDGGEGSNGGGGGETGEGSSGGDTIPTTAGGSGPAIPPAWKNYPNADFRERLAHAETDNKKNFGYGEINNSNDPQRVALGRYQLTPGALRAAGMMDRAGNWTGKYGIHSRAEFLGNPDAQEKALTDYLDDNQRQLRANGAFTHIGETIDGLKARFPVTLAGIIAAAHREGANATADYLDRVKANGLASKGLRLKPQDPPIETRLRTFSDARYE